LNSGKDLIKAIQSKFSDGVTQSSSEILESVIPISDMTPEKCIEIYRKGYFARLTESLGETFEATWWVLGDDAFFELCQSFIHATPSRVYDLSNYGQSFPEYVESHSLANDVPFVHDLARFEWTFKDVFHSPNIFPNKVDWSKVVAEPGAHLFRLSKSARIFESNYAVYEIWKMRANSADALNLDIHQETRLLIYKHLSQVTVRKLASDEFCLFENLSNGNSLENSIEAVLKLDSQIGAERVQELFSTIRQLDILELR